MTGDRVDPPMSASGVAGGHGEDLTARFLTLAREADRKGRGFEGASADSPLEALGLDSITVMEILGRLEDELGVCLADKVIAQLVTIEDVADAFRAARSADADGE